MIVKDKRTFKGVLTCGLIPMVGGLGIFFSWWIGKAWFLTNLLFLELWGFYWILISLVIVLIGFFMIGALIIQKDWTHAAVGLVVILLNIPILTWVLYKQGQVDSRAYVRLYNGSGVDIAEIVFTDSSGNTEMGGIKNDSRSTIFFYPIELGEDYSSVPVMDSVKVTLKTRVGSTVKLFPTIYKGQCERISIGKEFGFRVE